MIAAANTAALDRVLAFVSTPQRRIGTGVMRAGLGAIVAMLYVQNIPWRQFLWGPDGMVPMAVYTKLIHASYGANLYLLSSSPRWFEAIFWIGLAVTVLWAAGVVPTLTGPVCFAFTWSLLTRNTFVQDAGWNLLRILMVYLIFADTSFAALGVLRVRALAKRVPRTLVAMRGIVHNGAVVMILFQLCVLYGSSVFYKIQGHKWQDGTVLYYVLRANQFDLSWSGSLIWHSAFLVAALTYGTLLFQAAYPFWIWQRPYKYAIALAAIGFHVGILVTMALPFFSAIMIVAEAVLFGDEEYRRAYAWVRARLPQRLRALVDEPVPAPAVASTGG
jgi:hypothetical protein